MKVKEFRPDTLMVEDYRPKLDTFGVDVVVVSSGVVICTVAGVVAHLDSRPVLGYMYIGCAVLWGVTWSLLRPIRE